MNKTRRFLPAVFVMAIAAIGALEAAPDPAGFEKASSASVAALKIARGKPTSDGLVFVNGHFLKPPYRVVRYGNVIAINDVQVTGPLVPWSAFTTAGAPPPAPKPAVKPSPAVKGKAAAPAKPAAPKAETIDDLFADAPAPAKPAAAKPAASGASSLDDLFDDTPAKPAKAPAAGSAASSAAAADSSGESASDYLDNARSKQLLKRMNDYRTMIDGRLRKGEACFFGVKYAFLPVDPRLTRQLLEKLPETLREASDAADLCNRLQAQGAVYVTPALCADLIAHRTDFTALEARRAKLREDDELKKLLGGAR